MVAIVSGGSEATNIHIYEDMWQFIIAQASI